MKNLLIDFYWIKIISSVQMLGIMVLGIHIDMHQPPTIIDVKIVVPLIKDILLFNVWSLSWAILWQQVHSPNTYLEFWFFMKFVGEGILKHCADLTWLTLVLPDEL